MAIQDAVRNRAPTLDADLESVDNLAQRWSCGERPPHSMHPLERIQLLHDGAVLGGSGPIPTPDDLLKFDACFIQSSMRDRSIITVWYTTGGSAEQKAKRLGISRATLYVEWKRTLSYFRGWLRAHGIDI
jgi:hypothetical protein